MSDGAHPRILGLDTSTEACSAALHADGRVVAQRFEQRERGHAERIVPLVLELLAEAAIGFDSLDAIAVTTGPGSFTGVRIGLATARGFTLASQLPLIGIGTLEVIAAGVPAVERAGKVTIATIAALPGQVYAQAFDEQLVPLAPAAACTFVEVVALAGDRSALLVGTSADEILAAGSAPQIARAKILPWPQAGALVAHVAQLIGNRGVTALAVEPATPLYIKAPGLGPAGTRVSSRS